MDYFKKNKILIWVIIILLATNIATIATVIYHVYIIENNIRKPERIVIPDYGLGRFFREELNLTREQQQQFRSFRQNYRLQASKIIKQMQEKRLEMLDELSVENSDTVRLHQIADEIGAFHRELKHLTFEYYLNLKDICNDQQRDKLFRMFKAMQNSEWELKCRRDTFAPGSHGRRNTIKN